MQHALPDLDCAGFGVDTQCVFFHISARKKRFLILYPLTNMAELFKKFEDNGVTIISPPQSIGNPDGSKWGMIADPEGNGIQLAGQG